MIDSDPNETEIAPKNVVRFSDFVASGADRSLNPHITHSDDSINIQFTSGTTGHPKAATLTHHNVVQNARFVGKRLLEDVPNEEALNLCLPNPLYHCFGSVLGSILIALRRGTLILPAPVFDPVKTLEAVHNHKCNIIYGTPTMYVDILNSVPDKYDTKTLFRGIMAGAPCPPPLIERTEKQFNNLSILVSLQCQ